MISNTEFKAIEELDLDPIKVKLMHKESGEGWTLEYAEMIESEYRRFLYLMKMFPNEPTAPLFDVDIFWHYHILDTMKYVVDCESVFGYFLHHFPYVGLRGEEDEAAHRDAGQRMKEIYEQTFGEPYGRALQAAVAPLAGDVAMQAPGGNDVLRTAWSVKAVGPHPVLAGAAWSVRVPDGTLAAAARTAWSVQVPAVNVADGGRVAWSVKVAQDVVAAGAGKTAWSVKVPARDTVPDAFYTRRPVLTST